MDLELSGKTAIIAGATGGLGRVIAHELAAEGVDLALVARGRPALDTLADEIARESGRRVVAIPADTGRDDSVAQMTEQALAALGRLDILVNSAAPSGYRTGSPRLAEITSEKFADLMNVKVMGALRCARAVAPHMIGRGWGRIINVSGILAREANSTLGSIRNVALVAMTKNLADELGPHGINVTVVHPGTTRTKDTREVALAEAQRLGVTPEEIERRMAEPVSIGRLIDARELAYVVVFLASPKSVAINGDVIAAGGGWGRSIYY